MIDDFLGHEALLLQLLLLLFLLEAGLLLLFSLPLSFLSLFLRPLFLCESVLLLSGTCEDRSRQLRLRFKE